MNLKLKLSLTLFFLALLIRLPLLNTNFYKTPDAIEYLNPALNLISGQGFISTLKVIHIDHQPLIHPAVNDRPIGFSLLLAPFLLLSQNPSFIQLILFIFNSFNAVLIFTLFSRFLSPAYAFIAGLLLAFNPNILITNRLIMPEPFYLFFILLGLLFFYSKRPVFISGLFFSLAWLIRPETIFLTLPLFIYLLAQRRPISSIIFILPTLILAFIQNPFNLLESYHYRLTHFSLASTLYNQPTPSALTFIKSNLAWILAKQWQNTLYHLKHLFSLTWLSLLTFPLFICPKKFIIKYWPLLVFPVCSFFLISLTWSIFPEPARMLLVPFVFLILFALKGLSRLPQRISLIILIVIFSAYAAYDFHRITWARIDPANHQFPYMVQLTGWLNAHTSPQAKIVSIDPWTIYWATRRPSLILPLNLDQSNVNDFINFYHPDYIITAANSSLINFLPLPLFTTDPPLFSIFSANFQN
ncbi:MAG: glycosyltransferase family 39 protein [Candidatus Beckwithbacteria bacterium]